MLASLMGFLPADTALCVLFAKSDDDNSRKKDREQTLEEEMDFVQHQ